MHKTIKIKVFIIIFLQFFYILNIAQISDDFSDGDFTNNPTWNGTIANFEIQSQKLHLNAPAVSDTSYLSTECTVINNAEWSFNVEYDFKPYNSNYARVYIVSNNSNLQNNINGYFVRVGYTDRDISFCKQSGLGSDYTILIDGTDDMLNTDAVNVTVKVTHNNGTWELFADTSGNTNYVLQGTTYDTTYNQNFYMGVWCKYTSSRSDLFYFDNFNATGTSYTDTIKPEIENVIATSNNTISVFFSELLNNATTENINNYSVNSIGNPATAVVNATNPQQVDLVFSQAFTEDVSYTLSVNNIEDFYGNIIQPVQIPFAWVVLHQNDVVITEIMPDPTPVIGLPEAEYIEIYNTKNVPINLKNWKLEVNGSQKTIPQTTIPAHSYLILCDDDFVTAFEPYGQVSEIGSFPSLTNTGANVRLIDSANIIISEITYSELWYQDSDKDDGGYSLEKIDPNNNCSELTNWQASNSTEGGTPGSQNSIFDTNIDTQKPTIIRVIAATANTLTVKFNEQMDTQTVENIANYTISTIGQPDSISLLIPEKNTATIYLPIDLQEETSYSIDIKNTADLCGNIADNTSKSFSYYIPALYDVVINEFMADPSPIVGLPNEEYVELYNTTNYPIALNNWRICSGTTEKTLPDSIIEPHSYATLVDDDAAVFFGYYENKISMESMVSISNEGQELALKNPAGNIIHAISFDLEWYKSDYKSEGGWSLEQIDYNNPCGGYDNWRASESQTGGTPGSENSVYNSNLDNLSPDIIRIGVIDSVTIQVYFSEPMDSTFLYNLNAYKINNSIGTPISAQAVPASFLSVILTLPQPILTNYIYTLTIENTLNDCSGNAITTGSTAQFALPHTCNPNDIVINEILFNPKDNGVDFVELYNNSDKTLDLQTMCLATKDLDSFNIESVKNISESSILLFPNSFCVLSKSDKMIKSQYYTENNYNFYNMESVPSYSNEEGVVVLCTKTLNEIDAVHYNEDMHFSILTSFDGVSLERINYNTPSTEASNWHSASEMVGYATPGYKNSQYISDINNEEEIEIFPEVFSPDNDGYNDVVTISYKFDKPGYVANVDIYNSNGQQVKRLIENKLLSVEGNFSWNGINEDNLKCNVGIYIFYIEVFDLDGNLKSYKKTCVLATKM